MPGRLVLLGDSIFDNGAYVPGGPSVLEHVRRALPQDWHATLLAVDGAVVSSVYRQLERLPAETTHLALSVGGNNALWTAGNLFALDANDVRHALGHVFEAAEEFAREYQELTDHLNSLGKPLAICTIYDAIPDLGPAERAGLCVFNDIITRTAFSLAATLVDLRLICREATDYAAVSPIEPSASGGRKIAIGVVEAALGGGGGSRVIV